MLDHCQRKIDYMRISITDRCNLRCIYCIPEEGMTWMPQDTLLTYDEIEQLTFLFSEIGIKKIKITGGEPLIRNNVKELVYRLKHRCKMESVTLTTNGILLEEQIDDLVKAGLDGVNISLDTMSTENYRKITKTGDVKKVLSGIQKALTYPELSVKINCVSMNQTKEELLQMIALTKHTKLCLRFIEMMPIGLGKENVCVKEEDIRNMIEEEYGKMEIVSETLGNGPAHYFKIPGFEGNIGFISAISHKFCKECNRIRMSADGHLKTCLFYEDTINLKKMLQEGISEKEIKKEIQKAVYAKPSGHHFLEKQEELGLEGRKMSQIGG